MLDLPGLVELLTKLHRREISLVEVETPTASPFASSLLFDYVATYMYEGDTPNAERRAAALSLDRELLRELLGQEELRDLIDPGALAAVEADLQCLSETPRGDRPRRAARRAAAARRPDGGGGRGARAGRARRRARCSTTLRGERRAVRVRVAGEERWIDAADAGLYRDALGVAPPGGLPAAFLEDVPDALRGCWSGTRPPTGRSRPPRCARATASTPRPRCASWSATGALVRGELRPGGSRARVVRPRGAAAAAPRLAGGAAQGDRAGRAARAGALPAGLAGRRPPPGVRRRDRPAARGAGAAAGRWRCRPRCGSATCCRAGSARTRRPGSTSCAPPARSSGSAPARSAAAPAGWRSTSARTWRCSARRPVPRSRRLAGVRGPRGGARAARARGVLLHRPAGRLSQLARGDPGGAVGPGLGGRGHQRRVRAAARAAADAGPGPARRAPGARRAAARRRGAFRGRAPPRAGPPRRSRAAGR